ncbi:MAG: tetratricopeptide repeat protein [Elainellaceae cyanobacterium]
MPNLCCSITARCLIQSWFISPNAVLRLCATVLLTAGLFITGLFATVAPPAKASAAPSVFQQGVAAYQKHDYTQAIDAFTQVIEQGRSPSLAAAYGNRCLVEVELQAYRRAIADCTHGLALNPVNTESYLNRGLAYYRISDYAAAIDDYSQRLTQVPDDYRAFYNRGLAQAGLDHSAQAIADYSRAIEITSRFSPRRAAKVYADRGITYLQLERYDSALADFSQAIAHDSAQSDVYFNRAYAAHSLGQDAAALSDLKQVLSLDPTHAKTHFNLGMLYYQLGHVEGAIASFEQAAYHFFTQNNIRDYERVMAILEQLQTPSAFG